MNRKVNIDSDESQEAIQLVKQILCCYLRFKCEKAIKLYELADYVPNIPQHTKEISAITDAIHVLRNLYFKEVDAEGNPLPFETEFSYWLNAQQLEY